MKTVGIICGIALTATLAGCLSGPDTDSGDSEPMFTQTAVHLNADGTETVVTRSISAGELRRQQAERALATQGASPDGAHPTADADGVGTAAEAFTVDASCASASFWLFDQADQYGDVICFSGEGIVDLSKYSPCAPGTPPYLCLSWVSAKKSYYSGTYGGNFQSGGSMTSCLAQNVAADCKFGVYNRHDTLTSTCEAPARYLNIGPMCWMPSASVDSSNPIGVDGYDFTPHGVVKVELLKNGADLYTPAHVTADASGHVSYGYGNPPYTGNHGCGESIRLTDVASSLTAEGSIVGWCF